MFSRKLVIFQKNIFYKTSSFSLFGSNHKWVGKRSLNFTYLAYHEIELFSKKKNLSRKQFLKNKQYFFSIEHWKMRKLSSHKIFHPNKWSIKYQTIAWIKLKRHQNSKRGLRITIFESTLHLFWSKTHFQVFVCM